MKGRLLLFNLTWETKLAQLLTLCLMLFSCWGFSQTVKGKITDGTNKESIPGATVFVKGTTTGGTSDLDGAYTIKLTPGTHILQISFVGYKTIEKEVSVTDGETVQVDIALSSDVTGLEELVVLGTRRVDRTVIESSVPVDVLSPKEIEATGFTQTADLIQSLVPSFNSSNKNAINDGSDYVLPANLRGLGPEHVLVLVNGKRRHISALTHVNDHARGSVGVDLNTIPPSSIERIEVLRDGAAAQYGSDAIGGVINLVLKKNTKWEATMTYGQHLSVEERGFKAGERLIDDEKDEDFESGVYDKNWMRTTEKVTHKDGQNFIFHLGKGFEIGKFNLHLSGQYRQQGRSNRAGPDPRYQYFGSFIDSTDVKTNDASQMDDRDLVTLDPREKTFDRMNHWYGKSELKDLSFFMNGGYELGDGKSIYFFGGISHREGLGPCYYRRALDDRTVRSIYPDGFLPQINPIINDQSIAAGYKGKAGEWSYDISQVYGRSSFNFNVTNTINTSLGDYNDGLGQKTKMDDGTLVFAQASTNLDFNRQFQIGWASPLNFAVGGEFRHENYKIKPGEPLSYKNGNEDSGGIQDGPNKGNNANSGCQCLPGFSPDKDVVDSSRINGGVYLDLEADPAENLTFGVAGRFENYSDFGSNVSGKLSGRWEMIEGLALRGAASTGFRAPALAQRFYSSIATNAIGTRLIESGTFPVHTDVAKALGATNLKAEKSFNLSAGITFNKNNFSVTVDAYQIILTDRIILSEDFAGKVVNGVDQLEKFLSEQGIDAARGRYFTNALNTKTQGIDITGRYAMNLSLNSTLRFTLAANLNKTNITNQTDTPDDLKPYTDTKLLGEFNRLRMEEAAPRSVFNLTLNYEYKDFGVMLRNILYGKFIDVSDNTKPDGGYYHTEYPSTLLNDLEFSYKFSEDKYLVALGTNNLFDIYPQKRYKGDSFNGIFQYGRAIPYGFNGRYVYLRAQLKL